MTDPMTAALAFLTSSPAPMTTLIPATPEHRRHMLEDTGHALRFALEMYEMPTGTAHEAALQVFAFAADVWGEYLNREADPDTAALNLHTWASRQASTPEALPVGTAAAWRAVRDLAAMTAGAGYADGEPEDLIDGLLSSLRTGRVLN